MFGVLMLLHAMDWTRKWLDRCCSVVGAGGTGFMKARVFRVVAKQHTYDSSWDVSRAMHKRANKLKLCRVLAQSHVNAHSTA